VLWRKPRRSRVETRGTARAVSGTPRRGNDPSAALHACCVLHQRAHSSLPQHHARTLARRAHGWRMGLGGRTRPVSPLPVPHAAGSLSIERRLVLRHSAPTGCVPSATALALLIGRRDGIRTSAVVPAHTAMSGEAKARARSGGVVALDCTAASARNHARRRMRTQQRELRCECIE